MPSLPAVLPPEVEDTCRRMGADFLEAMTRACRTSCASRPTFLPLAVTTITFTGTFGRAVPVERVRRAAAEDPELAASVGLSLDTAPPARKRRHASSAPRKSFTNQVSFRPAGAVGGKSAKLFYNGSLHVTGCSSALDFVEMAHAIGVFVCAVTGEAVQLLGFDVQMINAGTVVVSDRTGRAPMRYPPVDLCAAAVARGYVVDFEPGTHPGVKVVLRHGGERAATAFVFQTGAVTIVGARSPARVADAFELVAGMLRACAHVATPCAPCRTTSKRVLRLEHGYPSGAYHACIS